MNRTESHQRQLKKLVSATRGGDVEIKREKSDKKIIKMKKKDIRVVVFLKEKKNRQRWWRFMLADQARCSMGMRLASEPRESAVCARWQIVECFYSSTIFVFCCWRMLFEMHRRLSDHHLRLRPSANGGFLRVCWLWCAIAALVDGAYERARPNTLSSGRRVGRITILLLFQTAFSTNRFCLMSNNHLFLFTFSGGPYKW